MSFCFLAGGLACLVAGGHRKGGKGTLFDMLWKCLLLVESLRDWGAMGAGEGVWGEGEHGDGSVKVTYLPKS